MRVGCRGALLLCALLAVNGTAGAQVSSGAAASEGLDAEARREEAKDHFRRGVELFQEEAYRGSLVEFERAYEISPDYRLLYNIGQAKLQVSDYLGASQSFEAYLEQGGDELTRARVEEVNAVLAALRERVGRIAITVSEDGAEVFVDEIKVGVSPLPPVTLVNVGRHRVTVRTEEGGTASEVVDVAAGDLQRVSLTPVVPTIERTVIVKAKDRFTRKQKIALGLWSGGGALLATGAVTAFLTQSASDDLDEERDRLGTDQAAIDDKRKSMMLLGVTTDSTLAIGAGLAVAGTVLWFTGRDEPAEDKRDSTQTKTALQWGIGPMSITARGRF